MYLVMLMNFWREAVIAILLISLTVAVALYSGRGDDIKALKDNYQLQEAVQRAEYEARARAIEQTNYQGVINAINEAQARQQAIRLDIDRANAANERLHDTIDRIQANTRASSADRDKYTASVSELFKQCSSSITELAGLADGHANDVRLLQDARRK